MSGTVDQVARREFWADAFSENYPRLLSLSRWLTKNSDKAPDIVHDAACKVLNISPDPKTVGKVVPYLKKSVRNAFVDWVKRNNKDKTISLDDPNNEELRSQLVARESDVMVKLDNEALRRALTVQLKRLTDREKKLFILFLKGYSCAEIAAQLGEDVKVISYDLNAVRSKVYQRLKPKGRPKGQPDGDQALSRFSKHYHKT